MKNKLDKFFRQILGSYNLPNDGPQWADLENRMRGKKKPAYFLFGALGVLISSLVFVALIWNNESNQINPSDQTSAQKRSNVLQTTPDNESYNHYPEKSKTETPTNTLVPLNPTSIAKPMDDLSRLNTNEVSNSEKYKVKLEDNNTYPFKNEELIEETTSIDPILNKNQNQVSLLEGVLVRIESKYPVSISKPFKIQSAIKPLRIKPSILGVYLSFNPATIKSYITLIGDSKTHKSYSNFRTQGEKMKSGLGLEFGLQFNPIKKLSIASGVIIEERIEQVNYNFKRNEIPVMDSASGEIFGYVIIPDSSADKIEYSKSNTYKYTGIPITLNYQILSFTRYRLGIILNGSYLKQTGLQGKTLNRSSLSLEDLTLANSTQLTKLFNGGVGFYMSFLLSSRLTISIAPKYTTQFSNNSSAERAKQRSINLGIRYSIF